MFSHIFRHDSFGGGGREREEGKDKLDQKEDKGGRMTGKYWG